MRAAFEVLASVPRMAGNAPSPDARPGHESVDSDHDASAAPRLNLGLVAGVGARLIMSTTPPLAKKITTEGLALAFHRFFWLAVGLTIIHYVRGNRLTRQSFALAWPAGVLFGANIATEAADMAKMKQEREKPQDVQDAEAFLKANRNTQN